MTNATVSRIATHTVGAVTFVLLAVFAEHAAHWWLTTQRFDHGGMARFAAIDSTCFWRITSGLLVMGMAAFTLSWLLRENDVLHARVALFTAIAAWVGIVVAATAATAALRHEAIGLAGTLA